MKAEKVTAELGYKYDKSEKLNTKNWIISEIRNFDDSIQVDKKFIFRCLSAGSYKFEATKKSGISSTLDASKLTEDFGVTDASVSFNTIPENPDKVEVKINNPDICLSYLHAHFKDDNESILVNIADKYIYLTGENQGNAESISYILRNNETSNFSSPQFIGEDPHHKPWYRLKAFIDRSGLLELKVCKQNRENGNYNCIKELHSENGKWNKPYHIDTFQYEEKKYKSIFVELDAIIRTDKGGELIVIKKAKMTYPQYELVIN